MKIAFIIGGGDLGGAEVATGEIAIAMRALGMDTRVIFLHRGGAVTRRLKRSNVPYVVCSDKEKWSSARRGLRAIHGLGRLTTLARLLRSFRPDIVHAMLPGGVTYGLMVARMVHPGGRRIAGVHGHEEWDGLSKGMSGVIRPTALVQKFLYQRELNNSAAVTVVSESVGQFVVSEFNVPQSKVHWIPNGVNIPERTANVSVSPGTLINVANFHPVKGHRVLLKAIGLMTTPVNVKLLGQESSLRDELVTEVEGPNGPVGITFLPPDADPIREMLTAQVGVLASHSEGMPLALLEMMSVGLPIVATNVGGVPDLVINNENGFLVEAGDFTGMADAIQELLGDPALRLKFGHRSREIAQAFDWKDIRERYLRLYRSLV